MYVFINRISTIAYFLFVICLFILMYVDTHCHLTFPQFVSDQVEVITNARKAGVKKLISVGVDHLSSVQSLELSAKYPGVIYTSVGFHPYEAQKTWDESELEGLAENPHCIAIGECGLDYHIYKGETAESKKSTQKRLFEAHLTLAVKRNLPVIIHCRDAWNDMFDVLDSLPTIPHGVIHCFTGGLQDVRSTLERNLMIGIDGNVTYDKGIARSIPSIPLTSLLLETDAPYLTPVPHRGERNEPKYIAFTCQKIAELSNNTKQHIADITMQNARRLFGLE
jgi:TatD DNase family protein